MSEISDRILAAIQRAGLSYGELSKLTGIPKAMLQRYATGDTGKIPLERLQQIAKALGTTAEYLLGWDSEQDVIDKDRLEALHQNPRLGMLFDRQREMSESDIDMIYGLVDRILKERDGE